MSQLFSEWQIESLKLKNRIVIAPMCQYSAQEGMASSWHLMHLGGLSHSGAGLLIIEATAVAPEGRISWGDLGLYNEACEKALKNTIEEIKKFSSMPIAIQLAHAGRKASTDKPWLGKKHLKPDQAQGWVTVAPSAITFDVEDALPHELTRAEMIEIKNKFVEAAQRAVRAGFQGIELHSAHGYLLHQYLSPLSNQRQDEYGGTLENRMKFPLEVYKSIKEAVGHILPVWIRISATDWIEGGWSLEDSIEYCRALKKLGCELIHVSSGGLDLRQNIPQEKNYQIHLSDVIKQKVGIKTIAVGHITDPHQAEEILLKNQANAVGLARAFIYNPRWPWFAAQTLADQKENLQQKSAFEACEIPPQYLRGLPPKSNI